MARSFSRLFGALLILGLAPAASAQSYADQIDVLEIPEVDVLFKCYGDSESPEGALFGLAHHLSRRGGRVYSVLMSPNESHFGYVQAPYAVSAPAFFERDGTIFACVTLQSLRSLEGPADEEIDEPPVEAPDTVDESLDDAVDHALPADGNVALDANDWSDPNNWIDDFNTLLPRGDSPGYEEEDDLKIPKDLFDPAYDRGQSSQEADDPVSYLDPNNETDSPFFDFNDIVPPAAPVPPILRDPRELDPSPAPAPAPRLDPAFEPPAPAVIDDTANEPVPMDPDLMDLPRGLPSASAAQTWVPGWSHLAKEAALDANTDVLPPADTTHRPIVHPHPAGDQSHPEPARCGLWLDARQEGLAPFHGDISPTREGVLRTLGRRAL